MAGQRSACEQCGVFEWRDLIWLLQDSTRFSGFAERGLFANFRSCGAGSGSGPPMFAEPAGGLLQSFWYSGGGAQQLLETVGVQQ